MKDKKIVIYVVISLIIFMSTFFVGAFDKELSNPVNLYQVYLDGEKMGYIRSETELINYINEQEISIKEEFGVDEIYMPKGLDIRIETTFENNVYSVEYMYNKIKAEKAFTVHGYVVNVVNDLREYQIYLLDKDILELAIDTTVRTFVEEDSYELYLNGVEVEINGIGSRIEDVYVGNDFTITEDYISIDELIFDNEQNLAKYLLYGSLDEQDTYKVNSGETITEVAFNQGLSSEEFLIANPSIKSVNNLLYTGQEVNVGLIDPQIDVIVSNYSVVEQVRTFETTYIYDDQLLKGYDYVKIEGSNGLDRISRKIDYLNGDEQQATIVSTEELIQTVNKVVVVGDKVVPNVGDPSNWSWPTQKPYIITSPYGLRWGSLHAAIDLVAGSGNGYGSDIYAANNGTVYSTGYNTTPGNYIIINHNNGYYTYYCHLATINVSEGDVVPSGYQIGTMGNTGYSSLTGIRVGTHLHFGIWSGIPYGGSSTSYNPLNFY